MDKLAFTGGFVNIETLLNNTLEQQHIHGGIKNIDEIENLILQLELDYPNVRDWYKKVTNPNNDFHMFTYDIGLNGSIAMAIIHHQSKETPCMECKHVNAYMKGRIGIDHFYTISSFIVDKRFRTFNIGSKLMDKVFGFVLDDYNKKYNNENSSCNIACCTKENNPQMIKFLTKYFGGFRSKNGKALFGTTLKEDKYAKNSNNIPPFNRCNLCVSNINSYSEFILEQ